MEDLNLYSACSNLNIKKAKDAILKGANVNGHDRIGWTPMMYAVNSQCSDSKKVMAIIEVMVENEADIHRLNYDDEHLLFMACKRCHIEVVDYLLKHGINVDQVDKKGRKAIDMIPGKAILELMEGKATESVKEVSSLEDEILKRSIIEACEKNQYNKADKLLTELGTANFEVGTLARETPLIAACNYNFTPTRMKLLDVLVNKHGADVNQAITYDDSTNPNLRPDIGKTALMEAAKQKSWDVFKFLLDHGADIHAKDDDGDTPFMYSLRVGKNLEKIKALIDLGADINQFNNHGHNSIYYATRFSDLDTVKFLLERGVDFMFKSKDGESAYDYAVKKNHTDKAMLFNVYREERRLASVIKQTAESGVSIVF